MKVNNNKKFRFFKSIKNIHKNEVGYTAVSAIKVKLVFTIILSGLT